MNDDNREGWLPPGQAYRLKRLFWAMLVCNLGLVLSLFVNLHLIKEKDQQIKDLLKSTESLVDDTQSLIDRTKSLVAATKPAE